MMENFLLCHKPSARPMILERGGLIVAPHTPTLVRKIELEGSAFEGKTSGSHVFEIGFPFTFTLGHRICLSLHHWLGYGYLHLANGMSILRKGTGEY
jgi:hypothetical protein